MRINRRNFIVGIGMAACTFAIKPLLDTLTNDSTVNSLTVTSNKRLALVIDISACKASNNCEDCVNACHKIHNVPNIGNPKEEIKWLWTVPYKNAFTENHHTFLNEEILFRPSLVLCNHCDNPPCVKVCPTKATFKREDGIVMMDYHRCIGCRYCMAACPYGSRSFNWRDPRKYIPVINNSFPTRTKGVVEKCNFCEERIASNMAPACVDACKNKAILFGDLNDLQSDARKLLNTRYSIVRKPALGTNPQVYYVI